MRKAKWTKIILITAFLFTHAGFSLVAEAAVGDGEIMYDDWYGTSSYDVLQSRSYTHSSETWGSENFITALIDNVGVYRVIVKASPQDNEYVAGVLYAYSGAYYLRIYTNSGGGWSSSWNITPPTYSWPLFDIAYEQDSGDCLVVYSNGGTTNELSYRKRVNGSWDGSSTTLESYRTTGAVHMVRLAERPSSDEIALVFADANEDLSAFIWNGSSWGSEPSSALTLDLVIYDNAYRADAAYENSGDLLVLFSDNSTAEFGYATKAAGSSTWNTSTQAVGSVVHIVDLGAEPGTNYIAAGGFSGVVNDLQLGIWNGSSFEDVWTADTNCAAPGAGHLPVACGWDNDTPGDSGTGRAICLYEDVAATTMSYFTWLKISGAWVQSQDSPATYSPPFVSGTKNIIQTDPYPNFASTGKNWVIVIDSMYDLWTAYTKPSGGAFVDDGSAGNNAIEYYLGRMDYPCADAAFTNYDPTLVELVNLKAESKDEDEAEITWRTASELRTRGFRLYRTFLPEEPRTYEQLTPEVIPAFGNPLSGKQYKFVDKEPPKGIYYILEEVLKNGNTEIHEPVQLDNNATFLGRASGDKPQAFLRRDGKIEIEGNIVSRRINPITNSLIQPPVLNNFKNGLHPLKPESVTPLKIEVNQEGVYRLTSSDLMRAGWHINSIDPRNIALFNQGRQTPIYISGEKDKKFDAKDYIEFYGKPATGRYTDTNIYWLKVLQKQNGLRMGVINSKLKFPLQTTYTETCVLEDNVSYFSEFKGNEHWFFSEEFIAPYQADFHTNLDHIDTNAQTFDLKISLQGASQMGFGTSFNRQRAIIYLNDNLIGEANWNLDEEYIFEQSILLGQLREGENRITIQAPDEEGNLEQFFLLNWIKINYPRELVAMENKIIFKSGFNFPPATYKIRGFTSADIQGYAIKNGAVAQLNNLKIQREPEGSYSVLFSDPLPQDKKYLILAKDLIHKPLVLYPDILSALKDANNQADYIIITHSNFLKALEPLVQHRVSQGLNVKVINVQDIYDEFNYGIFSPEAIKKFLKYAYNNWQRPKPTFVLLVGDGTFDYKDYWELGLENLVPVYLVQSPDFGETVSDNWYVDFDNDLLPEMLVGRFPVRNTTQLNSIIEKIIGYENLSPEINWAKELLFVADNEYQFEETSEALAKMAPAGYTAEELYLRQSTPEEAKQQIIENINAGKLIFNYVGHGGVTMLSASQVLRNEDVGLLNNEAKYPLFLALDCATGYFIYPEGLDALAEVMLTADDKGAIACITPSGLSSVPEQGLFSRGFYTSLFEEAIPPVLGLLHFKAKEFTDKNKNLVGASNKIENVIQTYNLLGDPALILRKTGTSSQYPLSLILQIQDILNQ